MKYVSPLLVIGLLLTAGISGGIFTVDAPNTRDEEPETTSMSTATPTAATVSLQTSESENTTNALQISRDDLRATRIERVTLSVGDAVAMDDTRLHTELEMRAFQQQFTTAETARQRRAAIRNATQTLQKRTAALHREARAARTRFNNDGSAYAYLAVRARLYAEATALDRFRTDVKQRAAQVQGYERTGDLTVIQAELQRFQGPVSAAVSAALRGETDATRVYIASSSDTVVLATIAQGNYRREVYRSSQRQPTGARTVESIDEATVPIKETYPWAWRNLEALTVTSIVSTGTFVANIQSPQGQLDVYVDAHTGNIYREVQVLPLSPRYLTGETTTNGEISVTVNRSYSGGPLRVRLTDRTTEKRLNGTVFINGERVGTTGSDGTLWTLAPHRIETIRAVPTRAAQNQSQTSRGSIRSGN